VAFVKRAKAILFGRTTRAVRGGKFHLAISRQRKEDLVAHYSDMLGRSQGVILTEFRGMTDKDLKAVRKVVREANGTYRIIKTTLLLRALETAGYPVPDDLKGIPLAVGFCFGDMPAVAKALTDSAKQSDALVIRGGLMGQTAMSAADVVAPSIDVLHAQILGLLDAPAASLVGVIQAGVAQVINVINAYAEKEQGAAA
jgi:large subunit ribosomal protein L10